MIEECDYLLIGGGVGAYTAAKRLRRDAPDARIVLLTGDTRPPYHLPPLSKEIIRGDMEAAELLYPSLASQGLRDIEHWLETRVIELDAGAKFATTDKGTAFRYGQALIATGSSPVQLSLPGCELPEIFYLRSADDALRLAEQAQPGRRAAVVGAGFIGVELAASLHSRGVAVTLIETADRIWPRFADPALARFVQARCEAAGIVFSLGQMVSSVEGGPHVSAVRTATGERVGCDFVCVGIGARPNLSFAQAAGLRCADGIVVDAHMRTSAPDVFAIGDVAHYPDPYLGRSHRAEHWGHAEYTGQIAAMNMLGKSTAYDFLNYVWSDVFDLHIESAGHVEDFDQIVTRGDPASSRFTNLYFRERMLTAYTAVNGDQSEFPAYRRLIKSRKPLLRPEELADTMVQARSAMTA